MSPIPDQRWQCWGGGDETDAGRQDLILYMSYLKLDNNELVFYDQQATEKQIKLANVVSKSVFVNPGFEGATPMLSCTRCCRSRAAGGRDQGGLYRL